MSIQAGDQFPDFTGVSQDQQKINLNQYRDGQNLVVFFYPKAMTSGCVRETTEFGKREGEFAALNTKVVGISVDSPESQKKHAIECAASFPILSDQERQLSGQLDILRDTGTTKRTTYVVGRDGKVSRIFENVSVDGHVDQVLGAVKQLSGSKS